MLLCFFCLCLFLLVSFCFFFKQKTAYEMRISDWSSDVCSSDLPTSTRPAVESGVVSAGSATKAMAHARPCSNSPTESTKGPTEIGRASCRERVCQYV